MAASLSHLRKRVYEGYNYRLRTFAGGRWADRCRPASIIFLLTELCNARCIHCDIWKNHGKEDSPSLDQHKQLLSDLRRWLGPVHVTFSGGEALLKPYAPELVAHGSSAGLFMELLTHGYWEDQSRIERLALARPWRVTVSLDGMGETHTKIRGRENFFEKTMRTIDTLLRMRRERGLNYTIRLKHVVMSHNLDEAVKVAKFATQEGVHVFYQSVEQNYNTPEDIRWFEHSDNWPTDTERVVAVARQLIELKRQGMHVDNSYAQLEAMIPYFRNPDSWRVRVQSHTAHEVRASCAALTTLEVRANGDVVVCSGKGPVGNVKTAPIRQIWNNRPRWWKEGCCLDERCSAAEKQTLYMPVNS